MQAQANLSFVGQPPRIEAFDLSIPADLAADYRSAEDFYTTAARRFLGRKPRDKAERNRYKVIILSIVNGLGAPSLARTLECSENDARRFLSDFERA